MVLLRNVSINTLHKEEEEEEEKEDDNNNNNNNVVADSRDRGLKIQPFRTNWLK